MKRLLICFLVLVMMLSVCACGKDNSNKSSVGKSNKNIFSTDLSIESVKKAKETDASLFKYDDVEGGVSITGFKGSDEIVVIPETIGSKDVVEIGEYAFVNNDAIKGLKISSKVQSISEGSFANCTALEVFVSGPAVKKICKNGFLGCRKLNDVELNDGLETLDGGCFGLTKFTKIEIPSSVTEINYPFATDKDHCITVIADAGSKAEQYVADAKSKGHNMIFQAK